ncbi:MAG TPA: hypothetical protein VHL58_13875 [Thermoanaerobaculia bacterium]|nr:hypothetical protein [Thermoanaerobaculia bacterium]
MRQRPIILLTLLVLFLASAAFGSESGGFGLTVVTDNGARPEFDHRGTVYVEALRGRSYGLRISNPTPYRVAVALSVDGLNTIDAQHTDPWSASKWVLEPYGSAVISGWQVNQKAARKFFFTGENRSYGAALGATENLGVIEAVYFRERQPIITYEQGYEDDKVATQESRRDQAPSRQSARAEKSQSGAVSAAPPSQGKLSDEYAATGMGTRTRHEVQSIDIDLEREAVASLRVRYEFRPQLVKLGIFPAHPTPLERRERARGFEGYCPATRSGE